jgi:hypothetical protein
MASSKRVKLHYVLCESALPENVGADHFGEFYICKAESSVWFAAKNGAVVSISDFLLTATPVAPPRHGRDGVDAAPAVKGERGPVGIGRDGRDGKDAVGIAGKNGVNGRDGRDGCAGPDSAAVLAEARAEISAMHSKFAALRADFDLLSHAFTSASEKTSDYLEFLKSRVAARRAAIEAGR